MNCGEKRRILVVCVAVAVIAHWPALGREPDKKDVRVTAEHLRSLLDKSRAQHDVPALAAGCLRGGGQPLVAVVGLRKRGTDFAATADDHWHLGSNTKPITSLLIALLIDMGLVDWDTPLERIFPKRAAEWTADLK